ncbi:MAG: hypothetical protein Q4D42_01925 [Eubacteriales bacterium]|nr:hypothetical protein [Eubacteriales bacterium]
MILFVDYNDVCRAPLAAAWYTKLHGKKAYSAGIYADEGAAICDAVRPAMLDGHCARSLSGAMLDKAEEIWCVTAAIARHLAEEQPRYADKIHALEDIDDPCGMGKQAYEACAAEIRKQVEAMR